MASVSRSKRGPTVLVTDSRDANRAPQRPAMSQRSSTRLISVDNVLQYASEIPSGQRRGPQPQRQHTRTPSGRHPADPKLTGRTIQNHMPPRTSKVSEKLVLLPETDEAQEEKGEFGEDEDDDEPPRDEELDRRKKPPSSMKEKSYAERLPKSSRTEKLPRVTAYCTAHAYKMRSTAEFVRTKHGAKTKLYDDCLYTVYHLPLLPGHEGYRIQSSPVLKSPGGKAVLDEEIERNERHEYREGFFGEEQYGVRSLDEGQELSRRPSDEGGGEQTPPEPRSDEPSPSDTPPGNDLEPPSDRPTLTPYPSEESREVPYRDPIQPPSRPPDHESTTATTHPPSPGDPSTRLAANLATFAEMFIFSYGVVVFWNFSARQEKDILADLTFASSPTHLGMPYTQLAIRPQRDDLYETEEFHFQYQPTIPRPRMFNDMITLRSGDHTIKLTISHAIAQSTKLSYFESRQSETLLSSQSIPKRLALRGELGMSRAEVVRILGRLFMSRVDVNLSSNMLDVPGFFWESEPTLMPLYSAVRDYLEVQRRVERLNERCRVFLDLAEMLSQDVGERKMGRLSWAVIGLIAVSIFVTTLEVFLRFGLLRGKGWRPSTPVGGERIGIGMEQGVLALPGVKGS